MTRFSPQVLLSFCESPNPGGRGELMPRCIFGPHTIEPRKARLLSEPHPVNRSISPLPGPRACGNDDRVEFQAHRSLYAWSHQRDPGDLERMLDRVYDRCG